jgi:hypothetical protein
MGGQEHFYLETNGTIAVPKGEDGEMDIIAGTQNPTETQVLVAGELHLICFFPVCVGSSLRALVFVLAGLGLAPNCGFSRISLASLARATTGDFLVFESPYRMSKAEFGLSLSCFCPLSWQRASRSEHCINGLLTILMDCG